MLRRWELYSAVRPEQHNKRAVEKRVGIGTVASFALLAFCALRTSRHFDDHLQGEPASRCGGPRNSAAVPTALGLRPAANDAAGTRIGLLHPGADPKGL